MSGLGGGIVAVKKRVYAKKNSDAACETYISMDKRVYYDK